ncbi:MAG: hypothetical protein IKO23_07525 [Bacteroidales bacterium]|nr:hypothetical protein [Bacteroidales bacterium]
MKTEEKQYCPYCGSKKIVMCKLPHGILIDPAPNIIDMVKDIFRKRYKCEVCGKEFN